MLSSSRGFDFFAILAEMDELGYDCEWQLFNSKDWGVPQNRERVYTIGHSRRFGSSKIFPVEGTDGENHISIRQIGRVDGDNRHNTNIYRVYAADGIAATLQTMEGGGREPHVAMPVLTSERAESVETERPDRFFVDYNEGGAERSVSNTITARYDSGVVKRKQSRSAVAVVVDNAYPSRGVATKSAPTLRAGNAEQKVGIPIRSMEEQNNDRQV